MNAQHVEGALAHVSPSFIDHAVRPGMPPGIKGTRLFFNMLFTAFPDLHGTIQGIIAEGDKVVDRMTCEGPHQGMFIPIRRPFCRNLVRTMSFTDEANRREDLT